MINAVIKMDDLDNMSNEEYYSVMYKIYYYRDMGIERNGLKVRGVCRDGFVIPQSLSVDAGGEEISIYKSKAEFDESELVDFVCSYARIQGRGLGTLRRGEDVEEYREKFVKETIKQQKKFDALEADMLENAQTKVVSVHGTLYTLDGVKGDLWSTSVTLCIDTSIETENDAVLIQHVRFSPLLLAAKNAWKACLITLLAALIILRMLYGFIDNRMILPMQLLAEGKKEKIKIDPDDLMQYQEIAGVVEQFEAAEEEKLRLQRELDEARKPK